ncbi:tetratricopeptide repeat protein, partial [bacterium]|nr:tetratricopeptide repeat protein [bacterium]
ETFVVNYPQSPQVQLALLRIGEIYEINQNQPAEALGAYQRLVEKFPRGQPSQIALQRIEILKQKVE